MKRYTVTYRYDNDALGGFSVIAENVTQARERAVTLYNYLLGTGVPRGMVLTEGDETWYTPSEVEVYQRAGIQVGRESA